MGIPKGTFEPIAFTLTKRCPAPAGLVETGRLIDRFRDRAMFPILHPPSVADNNHPNADAARVEVLGFIGRRTLGRRISLIAEESSMSRFRAIATLTVALRAPETAR